MIVDLFGWKIIGHRRPFDKSNILWRNGVVRQFTFRWESHEDTWMSDSKNSITRGIFGRSRGEIFSPPAPTERGRPREELFSPISLLFSLSPSVRTCSERNGKIIRIKKNCPSASFPAKTWLPPHNGGSKLFFKAQHLEHSLSFFSLSLFLSLFFFIPPFSSLILFHKGLYSATDKVWVPLLYQDNDTCI